MMDSSQMSVENMAQEEEKNVISELSWDTRHNLEKKAAYKMRISSLGYRNDALTGGIIMKWMFMKCFFFLLFVGNRKSRSLTSNDAIIIWYLDGNVNRGEENNVPSLEYRWGITLYDIEFRVETMIDETLKNENKTSIWSREILGLIYKYAVNSIPLLRQCLVDGKYSWWSFSLHLNNMQYA